MAAAAVALAAFTLGSGQMLPAMPASAPAPEEPCEGLWCQELPCWLQAARGKVVSLPHLATSQPWKADASEALAAVQSTMLQLLGAVAGRRPIWRGAARDWAKELPEGVQALDVHVAFWPVIALIT